MASQTLIIGTSAWRNQPLRFKRYCGDKELRATAAHPKLRGTS
jgi:hypothetical protein